MNKMLLALALGYVISGCSFQETKPASYSLAADPTAYVFSSPTEYYLFLPSQYSSEQAWPLFIGIHGSGGDGSDCLEWWQAKAEAEQFVLLCPSLADESGGWYADVAASQLRGILERVHQEIRLTEKYFLAGFSAGAEFIQIFAMENTDAIQGMAILASGNYYEPPPGARAIPYLVVIGEKDHPLSVRSAEEFAGALKQQGFLVEFHLLQGVGHEVTPEALELAMDFYRQTAVKRPER